MLIKEALQKSGLTKKAVEYYEAKKLIKPQVLENGYRDYSEEDLSVLKEISVLRECGISVVDIKGILNSANKAAALEKCKYIAEIRMQRLSVTHKCIANLINDYDVERAFNYLNTQDKSLFTIRERLVLAFPGNYGLYFALHFGRFLNDVVDTDEKRNAYDAIIHYLDHAELHLPPELSEFLETVFSGEKPDTAKIEEEINERMMEAITDTENYLARNRGEIVEYLEFRNSDEYKKSPAAAFQKLMMDFQKESGYRDIFIRNMKILSPSYAGYIEKTEKANAKFIKKFPQIEDIYDLD